STENSPSDCGGFFIQLKKFFISPTSKKLRRGALRGNLQPPKDLCSEKKQNLPKPFDDNYQREENHVPKM
ncbi:MAG: hypothetical protein KC584_18000, partial [Nitrospira sp.]|nr:hypothetical protein [Nitrospira sp.]